MFWLSYESFSILCDVFFYQKRSFPAKTADGWMDGWMGWDGMGWDVCVYACMFFQIHQFFLET